MTRFAALASVAVLAACSFLDPRPDPTRFYVLTSSPAAAANGDHPLDAALPPLGIGPVTLPEYLARPELVRRSATHELLPSRWERWGEPLDSGALRVLAEDLALFGGERVVRYPWPLPDPPTCQVAIDIARFEPVDGAHVELVANVTLVRFDRSERSQRHQEIAVALDRDDGPSVAKAMSDALLELARRIAEQAKAPAAAAAPR